MQNPKNENHLQYGRAVLVGLEKECIQRSVFVALF